MVREIIYKDSEGEEKKARCVLSETEDNTVSLNFESNDITESFTGENYFDALRKLRLRLEEKDLMLVCNGASLNVYPSGMAMNMGMGEIAYRINEGWHSTSDDLVNIFELDRERFVEATVEEQEVFFQTWNNSNRKNRWSKPKYSVDSIKEKTDFLFFWGHQQRKDGTITKSCLSQWWPCSFKKDGIVYCSTEQWMMAEKARLFRDKERLKIILGTNSPKEAKRVGRQVSNFNEDVWKLKRYTIVLEGNLLKFTQNYKLGEYLKSTADSIIVEASPSDKIWGIGMKQDDVGVENPKNWKGENLLGFSLMEVRDILNQNKH